MPSEWSSYFARRIQRAETEILSEILKLTQRPEVISFAGGIPAPELFPRERIKKVTEAILDSDQGASALQYSLAQGYPPLRQMLVNPLCNFQIPLSIDNVLITNGSQQALDLLGRIFINPQDRVLVEEPTYLGAIQAWNIYEPKYVTVATDENGIIPSALRSALEAGPAKLIYTIPNFQNPMGVTISAERRAEITSIASEYNVPIIEDNPYGHLRYEGSDIPHLLQYDFQRKPENYAQEGNVIHLGTFSKSLCPGFRVAWAIGPTPVIKELTRIKSNADLQAGTLAQVIACETAGDGFMEQHIEILRKTYKERRDVMLAAMEKYLPSNITWTHPAGGLFLWVRLPQGVDAAKIFKIAIQNNVAYVPGGPFFPNGGGDNTLRMSFSSTQPADIQEGIRRLAVVFKQISD